MEVWTNALCWTCLIAVSTALKFEDYTCRPTIDKSEATVYLPFDTVSDGEITDGTLTAQTLHGTAQTVEGKLGQALYLDGSTAISVGETRDNCFGDPELCLDGFTVALWVLNVVRENDGKEPYLLSNGAQTGASYGFTVLPETGAGDNDRGLLISVATKTKKATIVDDSWRARAKDGEWRHLVVTFKDEQMALYENGTFVTSATMADRNSAISETEFNQYSLGAPNNHLDAPNDVYWIVAYLDEFLFWDTWKSEAFVQDLYNSYEDTSSLSGCDENHQCINGVCECTNGRAGTGCDVDRQVLMRVATHTPDAGTVHSLWTSNDTFTPAIDDSVGPEYFSLSVDDKRRYKSPLVECSWSHVKNVRHSYYTGGEEVAYFSSRADNTDKLSWFGQAFAYDSSYGDLATETVQNHFSIEGDATAQRRFYANRNYDGCPEDRGWLVVLDTDHSLICMEWETNDQSILPSLMYCPQDTACLSSDWSLAEVMVVTADMGDAFGGSCVSSCVDLADGNYQSCLGCNVYVVCASQTLNYTPCRDGTRFDTEEGYCVESSSTCSDHDVAAECRPDGCAPNPCRNNGQCSMGTTGWVCDCSTDDSGYGGHTCEDVVSYCTVHSGENVCNNGSCSDEDNDGDYTCACDPGYTGASCEILQSYCTAYAASEPCKNGGQCRDSSGGGEFECDCTSEYIGGTCETPTFCKANENNAAVCINGGRCVNADDGRNHSCECAEGYTGDNCQNKTFCKANENTVVCLHSGRCVDHEDKVNYYCNCTTGYTGDSCESETFCLANPNHCQNEATCVDDGVVFVRCDCSDGFVGTTCGDVDVCATNDPCENGGTCNYAEDGSTECTCTDNWTGTTCGEQVTKDPNFDVRDQSGSSRIESRGIFLLLGIVTFLLQ